MPDILILQSPSPERHELNTVLTGNAHVVHLAETLGQALDILRHKPVGIMLVDSFINAPRGQRGPDMLKHIYTPTIPAVASSHDHKMWERATARNVTFLPKTDTGWDYAGLRQIFLQRGLGS